MQKFSDTKSWLPDIKNMLGNIPSWVGGVPQPKQGWNKFSDFLHSAMQETRKGPKLPGTDYLENVVANTVEVLVDEPSQRTRPTSHDAFLLPERQAVVNEALTYFSIHNTAEEYDKAGSIIDKNGMSPQVQFASGMDSKKMIKWFEDKNLAIPEEITRLMRTQWGETQTLVLDPTKKTEVLAEADRLRRLGFRRVVDPIPHMVKVGEDKKG